MPTPTNCVSCNFCTKIDGDTYQCQEPKPNSKNKDSIYGWIFSKQTAEQQALCDTRTNHKPQPIPVHEFGPQ